MLHHNDAAKACEIKSPLIMYPGGEGLIHLDPELLIAFVAAEMVGRGVGE